MAVTGFPAAARRALADSQLRANLARATSTIRDKRGRAVVDEVPDWEELREAGAAIKDAALLRLDATLETLEASVTGRRRHRALGEGRQRGVLDRRLDRAVARGGRGGEGEVDRHRRDRAQ